MSNSLSGEERLRLLVERFQELGEEPTSVDLEYFWQRREWLTSLESRLLSEAVAMFLYVEGVQIPRQRPWWRLLSKPDIPPTLVTALVNLPSWLGNTEMARPLDGMRVWAASGRMLIASLLLLPEELATRLTCGIWDFVEGGEEISGDPERMQVWRQSVLVPVLAFARNGLLEPCSNDCSRVSGDNPHKVDSLRAKEFWDLLVSGKWEGVDSFVVSESFGEPCVVGVDVSIGCPLVVSNDLTPEEVVLSLYRVLAFRKKYPDDVSGGKLPKSEGGIAITLLEDYGMAWRSQRL
ncbi:hypothetical protein ACFC0C_02190 [Streptomyces sp. NPDC056178]|uniref:hypothetical protein n=1 Tax=Streptomyces sp. NPDC056178 TaxID=3345735 RepID=UPI0035E32984